MKKRIITVLITLFLYLSKPMAKPISLQCDIAIYEKRRA